MPTNTRSSPSRSRSGRVSKGKMAPRERSFSGVRLAPHRAPGERSGRASPHLVSMARDPMPRLHLLQSRRLDAAARLDIGAARVEGAAAGRVDRTRHVAGEQALLAFE